MAPSSRPLLTTAEVARMMSVSTETIRRWAASGKLPAIRLGGSAFPDSKLLRFDADVIDRLLRSWATQEEESE